MKVKGYFSLNGLKESFKAEQERRVAMLGINPRAYFQHQLNEQRIQKVRDYMTDLTAQFNKTSE